jgi:hypothetical protein
MPKPLSRGMASGNEDLSEKDQENQEVNSQELEGFDFGG